MSTRAQRMQSLKAKLKEKPLFWTSIGEAIEIRCSAHREGNTFKRVAIYELTNYLHYRACQHPDCTYRIDPRELP